MLELDFTFKKIRDLYLTFLKNGYEIITVKDFDYSDKKILVLRHDVDRFPIQTLRMARLESLLGIRSTYYFRTIRSVFRKEIIEEVVRLGHEIGYHYEDLSLCKGNYNQAIKSFEENLTRMRNYYPVISICMHGSPALPWDNKKIWEKYNYNDYGIKIDTSFDFDYNKIFYITDNGFGWNKTSTSVRDKVKTNINIPIKNTNHLIELIESKKLPNQIMINAHPDTFFDPGLKWILNYSFIQSKNLLKWIIVKSGVYR